MLNDLRTAVRQLLRNPGFTLVAVITMALAIGANTAVLSIADAVLFRPLPYDKPEELAVLRMRNRKTDSRSTMMTNDFLEAIGRSSAVGPVGRAEDGGAIVAVTSGVAES